VAYQRTIDSHHPELAPRAAVDLGALLAEQGDVAGARVAYQRALDAGDPTMADEARTALQELA
jgi:hypothetical protein